MLDVTGSHEVNIDFCLCDGAPARHVQLLRQKWFPAVCLTPHTAATFRLLHHFHLFSTHSNISAIGFYENLVRLTDNTGLNPPSVSYPYYCTIMSSTDPTTESIRCFCCDGRGMATC